MKIQIRENIKFQIRVVCMIIICFSIIIQGCMSQNISAASGIKIRYNKKTIQYTDKQLGVTVDGKKVNLAGTPGIAVKNAKKETIYMVPAYDVFQKALGASYKSSNGKITISKWGTTINMTVGSKTAYVNGKKKTIDYAPTTVKYYNSSKTKVLVPSRFVATTLGYSYYSTNVSKTVSTVVMTSPMMIKYNGKWNKYTKTQAKLSFDGNSISVSDMPCISINGYYYVQAKKLADNKIGATYGYNSSSKTITLKGNGNTLKMALQNTKAQLNGKTVTMGTGAFAVTNSKTNVTYNMVPLSFVAKSLGYDYEYNSSTKTCMISQKDVVYFQWKELENTGLEHDSSNQPVSAQPTSEQPTEQPLIDQQTSVISNQEYAITEVVAERLGEADVVTVYGNFRESDISILPGINEIYVTFQGITNRVGENECTISKPYMLKNASISSSLTGEGSEIPKTELVLGKSSAKISYDVEKMDGYMQITFSKFAYKIAVDCGHGASTPGKRTPPLPYSLDFDNDGIMDALKGSQIREHTANVGVGEYLVKALKRCGFDVYQSAFGTEDVSLSNRQSNIKASGSDYAISIHFNAVGDGKTFNSSEGVEVFYHSQSDKVGDSKRLASAILNQVVKGTSQKNRGTNGNHTFAMCNNSAMGTKSSILLECAFMTNLREATSMMGSTAFWKETAEEVAKGFCDYTGVTYISE